MPRTIPRVPVARVACSVANGNRIDFCDALLIIIASGYGRRKSARRCGDGARRRTTTTRRNHNPRRRIIIATGRKHGRCRARLLTHRGGGLIITREYMNNSHRFLRHSAVLTRHSCRPRDDDTVRLKTRARSFQATGASSITNG